MKLLKMNAILIILSLSLCSCTELTLKSHNRKLNDFEEAYAENEKYLSNLAVEKKPQISEMTKMEEAAAEDMDHSFLEKPGQKIYKKAKKQIKPSQILKSGKFPSKNNSKKLKLSQTLKRFENNKRIKEQVHFIHIRKIPNPKIKIEDPKYTIFQKCNKKTGYLNLVKDLSKLPMELGVTPIFVSMSLSSFNLFLSPGNDKTLFDTVKLKNILWISQQRMLTGLNCFELVHGDVMKDSSELQKQSITLCAKDESEMKQWIDAVGAFKECQVNVKNIDNNRVVLADFQKVNVLLKESLGKGGIGGPITAANPYSSLYYNNNPTMIDGANKIQKNTAIKSEITKIVDFIKEGSIQQRIVARKMQTQLKEAKKFSEEVHQKQEIIKKILEKRVEKEKIRKQMMMKNEEKHKELELLKAVENRIMQMKKQEIKRFSNTYESQINEERKKAENESKEMMRTLIQEEKLTAYDDCTDANLMFFENINYVNQICFRYYGESVSLFINIIIIDSFFHLESRKM